MARAAVYEPKIVELLKGQPDGITTAELAQKVGCSRQQVYKVLSKPDIQVKVLGKGPTGAELLTWDDQPEGGRGPKATNANPGELPTIGAIFHIVEMRKVADGVMVVLEDEDGHRIESDVR